MPAAHAVFRHIAGQVRDLPDSFAPRVECCEPDTLRRVLARYDELLARQRAAAADAERRAAPRRGRRVILLLLGGFERLSK